MKVQDVMRVARYTNPESSLATAGHTMAEVDCGVLPVVEGDGQVVGVITDRDICLSLANRDSQPSTVAVREAMSKTAYTCHPEHPIQEALRRMREHAVRRLPVIENGQVGGIVSLGDLALRDDPASALAELSRAAVTV